MQNGILTQSTAKSIALSESLPTGAYFKKEIAKNGIFHITKIQFDLLFGGEMADPSWVHTMAEGISKINNCCSYAFKRH